MTTTSCGEGGRGMHGRSRWLPACTLREALHRHTEFDCRARPTGHLCKEVRRFPDQPSEGGRHTSLKRVGALAEEVQGLPDCPAAAMTVPGLTVVVDFSSSHTQLESPAGDAPSGHARTGSGKGVQGEAGERWWRGFVQSVSLGCVVLIGCCCCCYCMFSAAAYGFCRC
jgi:hypothetical protein